MRRLALLLFLVASAVQAQQLSDQITVNVVEVPVYVTRYNGQPVRGLTKDDFELFVNGRPQPVEYFDSIEPAQQAGDGARPELHRRRLFVLLFDDLSSSLISIHRAKIAAQKYVESAPFGDVFAVAVTTRRGIQFAVPFTTDRVAVLRAITTLRTSAAGDAFSLATLEAERVRWSGDDSAGNEWDPPGVQSSFTYRSRDIFAERQQPRVGAEEWLSIHRERSIRQLGTLAERLAPISGIKHVVLLREGMATPAGFPERFEMLRTHQKYRDAGVILDAVDIAGLQAPWSSEDTGLLKDPKQLLLELTAETGGTVAPTLDSLRRTQSITYILGFRPPVQGKKWNSIDVRMHDKPLGAIVQHRRGYSSEPAADDTNESLFLADVLLNDIPLRGVSVDLDVQREDAEATGVAEATVVAQVPGIELLALGAHDMTTMDVYLYVLDENDVVASWTQLRLNVDLAKGRDFLVSNPYTIRQKFKLGPGRYSAKALVQVVGSDAKGFQRASFEIPQS